MDDKINCLILHMIKLLSLEIYKWDKLVNEYTLLVCHFLHEYRHYILWNLLLKNIKWSTEIKWTIPTILFGIEIDINHFDNINGF